MGKLSLDRFSSLVDLVYQANSDAQKWETFVAEFSSTIGGVRVALHSHDYRSKANLALISTNWDPDFMAAYRSNYASINPWNEAIARSPVGRAQPSERLVRPDDLRRTQFYNEWVRPQEDIGTGAGITICRNERNFVRLSCNIRWRDQDRLQADLVAALDLLGPHLRRAFAITHELLGQRVRNHFDPILEKVASAVFLLDGSGRVCHANRRAEKIRAEGDVLQYDRHGGLVLRDPEAQRRLEEALDATVRRQYVGVRDGLHVRSAANRRSFAGLLAPFFPAGDAAPFNRLCDGWPVAIFCLRLPEEDRPESAGLARRFRLTPAEASLAFALYQGRTLREYADERGLSIQTVRKHLSSAFAKTGASQQSQLVALLAGAAKPVSVD